LLLPPVRLGTTTSGPNEAFVIPPALLLVKTPTPNADIAERKPFRKLYFERERGSQCSGKLTPSFAGRWHLAGVHEKMQQAMVALAGPSEDPLLKDPSSMRGLGCRSAFLDGSTCVSGTLNSVTLKTCFPALPPLEIPADQCRLWQVPSPAVPAMPPVGTKNTQGRRARMEDTDAVHENLLEVPLRFSPGERVVPKSLESGLATLWEDVEGSPRSLLTRFPSDKSEDGLRGRCTGGKPPPQRVDAWFHFVGVYDGHGGQMVSREAAENLHLYFKKAFTQALAMSMPGGGSSSTDSSKSDSTHNGPSPVCNLALKRKLPARARAEDGCGLASVGSDCLLSPVHKSRKAGEAEELSPLDFNPRSLFWNKAPSSVMRNHPGLSLAQVEEAVKGAFRLLDSQLLDQEEAKNTGSTAVVALFSTSHLCVANCGDSRAVLSRGGKEYRLTRDHKPELEDEQERIRSCGGKVLDFNGKRVMGLLAMSRAFGDHCLRDVGVVAEPEVTIIGRCQEDEFLVLGSDGLWDALSDREVCDLARRCFHRAKERGAAPETAARVAASVLMKAALDRGSNDNITVTVVDLR